MTLYDLAITSTDIFIISIPTQVTKVDKLEIFWRYMRCL